MPLLGLFSTISLKVSTDNIFSHLSVVSCFKSINSGLLEKIVPQYGEESEDFVLPAGPIWIASNNPAA